MAAKGKTRAKAKPAERYLAIPYHILNLSGIALAQKVLLSHIYSFGARGCWQSNETLAQVFGVSADTISRWLGGLASYLYVKNPKGYYRTMWARSHPDVRQAAALKQDKRCPVHLGKSAEHVRQNCGSDLGKSAFRLRQKCRTTNNKTNRETNRATKAPPSPLPAGGQASAVLAEREEQQRAEIERFKKTFGLGPKRKWAPLSEEQFERRRRKLKRQLEMAAAAESQDKKPSQDQRTAGSG